jgi:hypothetical protein
LLLVVVVVVVVVVGVGARSIKSVDKLIRGMYQYSQEGATWLVQAHSPSFHSLGGARIGRRACGRRR